MLPGDKRAGFPATVHRRGDTEQGAIYGALFRHAAIIFSARPSGQDSGRRHTRPRMQALLSISICGFTAERGALTLLPHLRH